MPEEPRSSTAQISQPESSSERSSEASDTVRVNLRYRTAFTEDTGSITEQMDEIFAKYNVVGGSVALFGDGEVLLTHHYGWANYEAGVAAGGETKYRIASLSKVVTALLTVMEIQGGGLALDDDIAEIVHPLLRNPLYPDQPILVRHLLTHTSSIIDGGNYLNAISVTPFAPLDDILQDPRSFSDKQPGEAYVYSNFGFGLLSGVLESVTGERFSDYAERMLFEPLGIDAGYMPDCIENPATIARMYENGKLSADPAQWVNMPWALGRIPLGHMYLLGQGELYITAEDLAKIAVILAGDGSYDGQEFLSPDFRALMHEEFFADPEEDIVMGLGVKRFDSIWLGRGLYGHEGFAYGMIAGMFYDQKTGTGMVLLTNGCRWEKGQNGRYSINNEMMQMLLQYF